MRTTFNRILLWSLSLTVVAAGVLAAAWWYWPAAFLPGTRGLSISGGDPHLRALMRTISASEANVPNPYHVLHGGETVGSLDQHPNQCMAIHAGPNRGKCSTAAGRYQLLHATWMELAQRYHPAAGTANAGDDPRVLPFGPVDQDTVVMQWLADEKAWGMDIAGRLQNGEVEVVFKRLSGTWTSLGYGSESNQMSSVLPRIYGQMLQEELDRQ
ncbi:glycoside hydrolase family protein [Hydrogenophaga sp. 5NK40-0174]|uniref:glycoside hydrolase family 24 protein n=1 Tax=Hydrogenophaga sp. 5NK40-0174 TaxID=3127649 RepID=UPI00310560F0